MMFGIKRQLAASTKSLDELKDELHKSKQEREAARLGLLSAVGKLLREAQSFPLDEKVDMVASDLAGAGRDEDVRS